MKSTRRHRLIFFSASVCTQEFSSQLKRLRLSALANLFGNGRPWELRRVTVWCRDPDPEIFHFTQGPYKELHTVSSAFLVKMVNFQVSRTHFSRASQECAIIKMVADRASVSSALQRHCLLLLYCLVPAYLFHIRCAGEQKEHSPTPGAVVAFSWFWRRIQNCRLTYLLTVQNLSLIHIWRCRRRG